MNTAKQQPPRQTHVAIELRVPAAVADALWVNLPLFASLVRKGVIKPRGGDRDSLLDGIEQLGKCVAMRMEPFDGES